MQDNGDSADELLEMDMTEDSFHLGSFVTTPRQSRLFVITCCLDGNTSIVYKCMDGQNRIVALKTIRERYAR